MQDERGCSRSPFITVWAADTFAISRASHRTPQAPAVALRARHGRASSSARRGDLRVVHRPLRHPRHVPDELAGRGARLAVVLAAASGDLFESMLKRDMESGHRPLLEATAASSTGRLAALRPVAAFYLVLAFGYRSPRLSPKMTSGPSQGAAVPTDRVKRVALLGATGSIGRQAIEIVAAHPGSRSAPRPRPRRRSTRTGPRSRSAASEPSCWSAPSRTSSSPPSSGSRASTRRSGRSSTASISRSPTRRASWRPASSRSPRWSAAAAGYFPWTQSIRRSTNASKGESPNRCIRSFSRAPADRSEDERATSSRT